MEHKMKRIEKFYENTKNCKCHKNVEKCVAKSWIDEQKHNKKFYINLKIIFEVFKNFLIKEVENDRIVL